MFRLSDSAKAASGKITHRQKAKEAGVPNGPLLKQLKSGEDVILEDGRVVVSTDVTGEPQAGFTVAILGDTNYCAAAVELARDTDILVHEATFGI